ncbi:MAG: glycoside hydrolase family 13 protein [Clostridia bacterium]|nr:glycoside hydrolase family 13 protein [Clostridia bacterium]
MLNNNNIFKSELLVNGKKSASYAFEKGSELKFALYISRRIGAFNVRAEIFKDSDGSVRNADCQWSDIKNGYDVYTAAFSIDSVGLYFLKIKVDSAFGEQCFELQLTAYKKGFKTPRWLKGGIMYQIFCDRFARSEKHPVTVKKGAELYTDWENGIPQFPETPGDPLENNCFFGGSLYGIIERLDYLQALGVTTLYLNPIFDAASNHKYDTADYLKVDEMFGGDGALNLLISELKKRGMHIILDGVFNHTGADSVYFNKFGNYGDGGAYQSKVSPYYDWYDFISYPDEYQTWWGVKILPTIKKNSESFKEFICGSEGVAAHYLKKGIDGWRLDVADELSDTFLEQLRKTARKINPESYILGEVWEDASNKIAYGKRRSYFQGTELDAVMNYPVRTAIIDFITTGNAEALASEASLLYRNYPKQVSDVQMNLLGTHDTERILNTLAFDGSLEMTNRELSTYRIPNRTRKEATERVKLAAFLCYTLPGVPCIYYGDEIGMEGGRDPFNRMPFAYAKADKALLAYFRRLGAIRSSLSCFKEGSFEIISSRDGLFLYKRDDTFCAVNLGASKIFVSETPFFELTEDDSAVMCDDGRYRYSLCKGSYAIFKKQ